MDDMQPASPCVSVVMPIYNVAAYVGEAIRSVLAQTFEDFELLLIDDGSTDQSVSICESFQDARIRLIRQANRGLAGARNTGIRHARGRFVAFLDSDDLWAAEKLARHVAHLRARPEVGVSYSASVFINDDGDELGYLQSPKLADVSARDVFLRNPVGNGSAPVIRRETLDDIAFAADTVTGVETCYFDESFRQSEDIECWTRIAITTPWRFEGLAAALTRYRVNASGLSANLEKQLASWEAFVAKTARYNPAFIRAHAARAHAYQLRYLARRALKMRATGSALSLAHRALRRDFRMLFEEPKRTLATLAAAYLQALLPGRLYGGVEAQAMRFSGMRQRARAAA